MDGMDDCAEYLENYTIDELKVGDSRLVRRVASERDILAFAVAAGDVNPIHLDPQYAASTPFKGLVMHGMWTASLIAAAMGVVFPGMGSIHVSQELRFLRPVRPGDALTCAVTVASLDKEKNRGVFDCSVTNQNGKVVLEGQAELLLPLQKIRRPKPRLPKIDIQRQ